MKRKSFGAHSLEVAERVKTAFRQCVMMLPTTTMCPVISA